MRILHLSMLYPPHILGGAERSVAMLAEATAAMGHDVAAACIAPQAEGATLRNGVTVYRMHHGADFWPEEWTKHSKPERFISKFKQQFNFALEKQFSKIIEDFKPDIVHTHSMVDVSTLTWAAVKKKGLPLLHTLRDYDVMCANSTLFHHGHRCKQRHMKCQVLSFTKQFNQRNVDGIAGVGTEILNKHLEMGYFTDTPKHLRRVVWNAAIVEGAGPGYRRASREGKPFTFGYIGRVDIDKGVGTVIDACKLLMPGNWQVKIAGRAATGIEQFEEMAKGQSVEFIGFMPPKEFFESIDVLIVPSIWPEPLPRTILESYAMGVPVIGSDSGGIPDLIGHDNREWLFAPGNEEELAMRMAEKLIIPRAELPDRSEFEHVLSETTPDLVAKRYLAFYDDVIAHVREKSAAA